MTVDTTEPETSKAVDTLDPFGHRSKEELEQVGYDTDHLAETAAADLDDEGADQPTLDGGPAEGAKVTFLGVQYNDVTEELKLGQTVAFTVKGRVIEGGEKIMADGHRRHFFKVDVDSVTPID